MYVLVYMCFICNSYVLIINHFATPTTLSTLRPDHYTSLVSSGQTLYQAAPLGNIHFTAVCNKQLS